jgi:hypothetical protein
VNPQGLIQSIAPFSVSIGENVLSDLRERLRKTRWPGDAPGEPWEQETDLDWLRNLMTHWPDGFDWHAQKQRLNTFAQFCAQIDGVQLHFSSMNEQCAGAESR